MNTAPKAGFVLDESAANYTAANPATGGDPATLNLPSLAQAKCISSCSWTRTVQSTMDQAVEWSVSMTGTAAANLTVSPMSFTLQPSGTQMISVTANVSGLSFNQWRFAEIGFTPNNSNTVEAH